MGFMHRFGHFVAVMAVSFSGVLVTVITASPAAAVCDLELPIQSGASTSAQNTIFGASAQVTYHNPVVCNQPARSSSAWVMVRAPNNGSPNGAHNWYFQVGYKKQAGGSPLRWAQWTKSCYPDCGSNPVHANWYGTALTGTHTYAVYLVAATQRLRATIDGSAIPDGPSYDPSLYWDSHWAANFAGETHDQSSDIPGVSTDRWNSPTSSGTTETRRSRWWGSSRNRVSTAGELARSSITKRFRPRPVDLDSECGPVDERGERSDILGNQY